MAKKWGRPDPEAAPAPSGTARLSHWNRENGDQAPSASGSRATRTARRIRILLRVFVLFLNLSPIPGFPPSPDDKRFYKMTVEMERAEMTTSDKRDTKLLAAIRAPSTQTLLCNGKYKADVEWKLNIVLPGWPRLHSEFDLKQGQSSFIISSKKFQS